MSFVFVVSRGIFASETIVRIRELLAMFLGGRHWESAPKPAPALWTTG
jgi:hypothetical protein